MSDNLEKKLDDLGHAIETAQKSFDLNLKETAKNASEEVTKLAQELQDQNQKIKGIEESAKFLEKAMAKGFNADESEEFNAQYRDQMTRYLRKGYAIDSELVQSVCNEIVEKSFIGVSKDQKESVSKAMFAGNDPSTGYFIRPELASTMITRIFETSPIRSVANVISTNSDTIEFIVDDNQFSSGGWVAEMDARPTTDNAQIGKLTIAVHEQYANPKATQKMLDDAGLDIEAWISGKVVDRMSRDENTAFVSGDGSQKPRGFLTYPDYSAQQKADANGAYGRGAIEQISTGQNGIITGDSLKNIQNSLKEFYQPSAIWGIRRKNFEQIITLKDSQGRYIFDTRFLQEERTLMLLGKQVVFMNDLPDAATGSLSMVYGDFSVGYTIVDRLGFRVIRDIYSAKPFVEFYTTKRVGGDVTNYEALKLLKLS